MWRRKVLRRTARICSAKAKELERMAKVDGNAPMRDSGTLKDVLKAHRQRDGVAVRERSGQRSSSTGTSLAESIDWRGPAHHALLRGGILQANRGAGSGGGKAMSDYGIKTYADLAETCGNMVLANEMAKRPLELVSGDWAPWEEIFQWYIIQDPSFVMGHTGEPVFYDEELDLVRPWGKSSRHGLAARARSDNLRLKRRRRAQRKQSLRPLFLLRAHSRRAFYTSSLYA